MKSLITTTTLFFSSPYLAQAFNAENPTIMNGSVESFANSGLQVTNSIIQSSPTIESALFFTCLLFIPLIIINFLYPKRQYKV